MIWGSMKFSRQDIMKFDPVIKIIPGKGDHPIGTCYTTRHYNRDKVVMIECLAVGIRPIPRGLLCLRDQGD